MSGDIRQAITIEIPWADLTKSSRVYNNKICKSQILTCAGLSKPSALRVLVSQRSQHLQLIKDQISSVNDNNFQSNHLVLVAIYSWTPVQELANKYRKNLRFANYLIKR